MLDRVWQIEEAMLDVYLLLVHRIEGIGLSLEDFWNMDTWTVSKFYCLELELIEKENKEFKNKGHDDYSDENNPEVDDLFEEMFEND